MEDLNQPLDAGLGSDAAEDGLKITDEIRSFWLETANWALFLAVLLFIGVGLVLIGMFFGGFLNATSGNSGGIAIMVMFFLYALVLFFPAWFTYKFSTMIKQAVNTGDNNSLEDGFDYLKRLYRFIGISIVAILALYVLFLVFGLAMMRNFSNM
jgi:hypothetical protein